MPTIRSTCRGLAALAFCAEPLFGLFIMLESVAQAQMKAVNEQLKAAMKTAAKEAAKAAGRAAVNAAANAAKRTAASLFEKLSSPFTSSGSRKK